ncbi:uncharacterized protein LOC122529739 [Frieseomelitta varia]|uniref:uncharacterized protein LOC122529739 n=1 Tax=Frieseomelitta varia TaxID=561572 RepID=UPI001CB6A9C5|nr:uncharacterized protein LOC122529739 [Frieseomelitta varia]XP_043512087.1 uncharacterized protein LOC122529739 [Frieseomelitta varia]
MHKSDSADFTNYVKLLLELMTRNSLEESANYETEDDYIISSDESDVEDNGETYSDTDEGEQNFGNGRHCDTIFRLNKFYDDHVGNTRKHLKPDARNDVWSDFEFEEKMYRVIPLKLDGKIFESKRSTLTNENPLKRKSK